jgi:hypothetical protein
MKRFLAALLLALWAAPALAQLGPGGSSLGPSGGGSGGTVPAGSIAIGTTSITGGTTTRVLYDNGGFVGEYTNTQLTALINSASSSLSGALPAFPGNTTTFFRGDGTYAALNLAAFPTQATNTVLGNATSGTAVPTALSVGTCSTASSALIWTTNTGFGCNTSITASAVAVGGITGLGTGVATALALNVGSAGAPVTFNGAGGTPSTLTLTNATGLPTAGIIDANVTNAKLANMATTTIKGQSVGGSGAPIDLTAAQAAAIVGSVGGALKSKTKQITRDLTAITGTVAYTGVGFQPTACVGAGSTNASLAYTTFLGLADSAGAGLAFAGTPTVNETTSHFLFFADVAVATNNQTADIASYDSDGFTLSWTKTGSPTGTATVQIMCFR